MHRTGGWSSEGGRNWSRKSITWTSALFDFNVSCRQHYMSQTGPQALCPYLRQAHRHSVPISERPTGTLSLSQKGPQALCLYLRPTGTMPLSQTGPQALCPHLRQAHRHSVPISERPTDTLPLSQTGPQALCPYLRKAHRHSVPISDRPTGTLSLSQTGPQALCPYLRQALCPYLRQALCPYLRKAHRHSVPISDRPTGTLSLSQALWPHLRQAHRHSVPMSHESAGYPCWCGWTWSFNAHQGSHLDHFPCSLFASFHWPTLFFEVALINKLIIKTPKSFLRLWTILTLRFIRHI